MARNRLTKLVRQAMETAHVEGDGPGREVHFDPGTLAQLTRELRSAASLGDALKGAEEEVNRILREADLPRTKVDPDYNLTVANQALVGLRLRELLDRQPSRKTYTDSGDGLRARDE